MDAQALQNVRDRTDAKLRYAQVHLDLLHERGGSGGSDFDRSVEESVLFHLFGAKEAFLLEINSYYQCGLPAEAVSPGKLRSNLVARGLKSAELTELYVLESEPTSWLAHAKKMRDHSAHVAGVPRAFHIGGENDGKVFFRNPDSGAIVAVDAPEALASWLAEMQALLEKLRASAIAASAA